MSNRLAIAAATATLQDRLLATTTDEISGARVVTARPEAKQQPDPGTGVNLFLYEVIANPFLGNDGLPSRNRSGALVQVPFVALDLHYLLTFFGRDNTLEAQRLLGAVVAELGVRPVLTAEEIEGSVAARDYLKGADLAEQLERIVLTPLHLTLEEVSRLWSVLVQQPYSLSIQYQASVVLVTPSVAALEAHPPPTPNIHVDASLTLIGGATT
jgi:Pvc16 N-terminal domain